MEKPLLAVIMGQPFSNRNSGTKKKQKRGSRCQAIGFRAVILQPAQAVAPCPVRTIW
jgi:hypothetical protein